MARHASAMLARMRGDLRSRSISPVERVRRLNQTVGSSALCRAGLWSFGATLARELAVAEMAWLHVITVIV